MASETDYFTTLMEQVKGRHRRNTSDTEQKKTKPLLCKAPLRDEQSHKKPKFEIILEKGK